MLKTQELLIDIGLEEFENKRPDISIRKYDDRYIFNYSQIESPKNDPITKECRALILDKDFNVLSRSFDRFFNYGELEEGLNINWEEYYLTTKIDGSLINLYYDYFNNKWQYSTRGTAFAEAETTMGNSFESICLNLFNPNEIKENLLYKDFTYIFELVSPENRVVTPYKENMLYLTGIRNRITGIFCDLYFLPINTIKYPEKIYNINLDICKDEIKKLNELDEGYIIISNDLKHRIKFKNPSWVNIHHLRENGAVSIKRIINLVFDNEYHEYLSYFPEDKQFFNPVIKAYDLLIENILFTFNKYNNIINQKDYAITINKYHFKDVLFLMRKGLILSNILKNSTDNYKYKLINPYIRK